MTDGLHSVTDGILRLLSSALARLTLLDERAAGEQLNGYGSILVEFTIRGEESISKDAAYYIEFRSKLAQKHYEVVVKLSETYCYGV